MAGADNWTRLRVLSGTWTGENKGQAGGGRSERTCQFVLDGRYLQVHNKSVFPPQEKNPKGEAHEDWGMISFDKTRRRFVYRQFHSEGFVNQYAMPAETDGRTFVFTSEAIENTAPGWRARETYRIVSEDEFFEVFELAEPGKEFAVYSEQHFRRASSSSSSAPAPASAPAVSQRREITIASPDPSEDTRPNSDRVPDVIPSTGSFERVVVLRFKFDTDLLAGLERTVKQEKIRNAVILSGAGSVRGYHVHQVSNRTFPSRNVFEKEPEAPADLIGMNGYVIGGRVHAHVTLADAAHAFGGHLEPDTRVFTFAVVTLGVLNDTVNLDRADDKSLR